MINLSEQVTKGKQIWSKHDSVRESYEDTDIDGWIILKWIKKNLNKENNLITCDAAYCI